MLAFFFFSLSVLPAWTPAEVKELEVGTNRRITGMFLNVKSLIREWKYWFTSYLGLLVRHALVYVEMGCRH